MQKLLCLLFLCPTISWAHILATPNAVNDVHSQRVLADLEALKALSLPTVESDHQLGVAVADLTIAQQNAILSYNHSKGRCGGFEVLDIENSFIDNAREVLQNLRQRVEQDQLPDSLLSPYIKIEKRPQIEKAIHKLKASNLKQWVTWLSSFPHRDNRDINPNTHVNELKAKLVSMIAGKSYASIALIDHRRTKQTSLHIRLTGSKRPHEIVVLGGHLDSINTQWGDKKAPGADDNASGSSNLIEILRVLLDDTPPERSIDIFWYAAEESGLLGSSEIAQKYKSENKNVIGVLQLDMTLHPGSGELTLASITDFTSPWLRDFMLQLNTLYVGARIIEDKCGYACSDHASWYRQGYPTLLPFEAATRKINNKIHSSQDIINRDSNFEHSLAFSKIGLAFAMELANSTLKQP